MSDPLSILAGVLGSYTACCEIFKQIQSIRRFHKDSEIQVDLLELQAYRVVSWGEGHSLRQKSTLDTSKTLIKEQEYLDKVLELFQDVKLLFNKYGIRYEKSLFPTDSDETSVTDNSSLRSSTKALLKRSMVPIRRLQWSVVAKEELISKCNDIKTYVDSLYEVWPLSRLAAESVGANTDISEKLQYLLENVLGSQKPRQLAQLEFWLSLDNLRLNPHQDLETYTKRLAPNSCQWIEDNKSYKAWRGLHGQKYAASILWIDGTPGRGKSILCASLVQKFKSEGALLAFFFSTRHAQTGGDINFILRFWLQQLAEKDFKIRQLMIELCSKDEASTRITNDDVWKLFRTILKTQSDLIFVIDGVDEYFRHEGNDEHYEGRKPFMLELMESCTNHGCNTRLLIVSRPMRSLNSVLSHTPMMKSSYLFRHSIHAEDVAQDTQLLATNFVRSTFSKFAVQDQDKLINEMVELSRGSFLWIDSVKKRMKPNLRIGLLSKEMKNVPADLREKYDKDLAVLAKIDPYRTLTIVSWILLAKQPLTVWEMCQVLAVQVDNLEFCIEHDLFPEPLDDEWIEDNISQFCGDMIIMQDNQVGPWNSWLGLTTLSPLHPSVSDHLLPLLTSGKTIGHSQQIFKDINLNSSAHLHIAKICFAWLISNDLEAELTVERPSKLAPRLKDYAIEFWHVHLEEAPDRDKFPLDLLLDFFQRENDQFVDWAIYFENDFVVKSGSHKAIASPLYHAASLGLENVVDTIIRNDPSQINLLGGSYGSALIAALSHKRLACFQHLLQKGADPDLQTESGCAFLIAVQLRAVPFLELLLQYHAYPKIEDKEKANALHILASYRHEDTSNDSVIFKMLLEQGLDLNSRTARGDTPLIIASAGGHTELVKMILSYKNVHLNAINYENHSAMYQAVKQDQLIVSEILLKAGADSTVCSRDGYTPFCLACENGNVQIVKMLIASIKTAGYMDITTQSNETPIFLAACEGHTNVVEVLLDNGAEHMHRRGYGFTPLHVACANGHLNVIQLLLKSGAAAINNRVSNDVAEKIESWQSYCKSDDGGSTSLILAAKRGRGSIVKALLEVRAVDMLAIDTNGQTALHHAAANGFTGIVKDLINGMPSEDLPRHNKNNPLYYSIQHGYLETVKTLLEYNFDVEVSESNKTHAINRLIRAGPYSILVVLVARWENTFNALWDCLPSNNLFDLAYQSHDDKTMRLLLRTYITKALDNEPDLTDWTPLGYAAVCEEQQIAIDLLVQLEARSSITNIDHYNGGKHTALHLAVGKGYIELVKVLLVYGADATLIDKHNGETSLHKAVKSGQIKLVEMLLNHLQSVDRLDMLNLADYYSLTPILEAISGNYPDIIVLLLEWGADATGRTSYFTPLYQAVKYGYREIVVSLLTHLRGTNKLENIEQGSMINGERVAALFEAIIRGDLTIARDLIEYGADVSRTWQGPRCSPMINIAVSYGHWQIAELICLKDPSVLGQTDADGWTPLIIAAYGGNTRMVRLLLDQPNDTTYIVDPTGRNAFHYAAAQGHSRIVKLLLQHSPSLLNTSDLYGATALSLAARRQQKETVEFLMKMPDIDYYTKDIFGKNVANWLVTIAMIESDIQITRDALDFAFSKMVQPSIDDQGVVCDICMLSINMDNPGWHCEVCHGNNFDICQRCRDAGAHCHDREHELKMEDESLDEHKSVLAGNKEKSDRNINDKSQSQDNILLSLRHNKPAKSFIDKVDGASKEAADENSASSIPSNLDEDFDFDIDGLPNPKIRQRRLGEIWRRSGKKAFDYRRRQATSAKVSNKSLRPLS